MSEPKRGQNAGPDKPAPAAPAGSEKTPAPAATPAVTRRYIVKDKNGKERMGKATSKGTAIEHVYATEVRTATPDDVERLLEAGIKTEDWTAKKSAD